jgi:hypothetical protein
MVRRRIQELHPELQREEPPAGAIRNVLISNVIARGKGTSLIRGRPDSPLEGIRLENVRLFVSADPAAPFEKGGPALQIEQVRDFALKEVAVIWDEVGAGDWQSAIAVDQAQDLWIDGFRGRQAVPGGPAPVIALHQVQGATIRRCRAEPGASTFLGLSGDKTREICLWNNDLRYAQRPHALAEEVGASMLRDESNLAS